MINIYKEVSKTIKGFSKYEVTKFGTVFSNKRNKWLKNIKMKNGYYYVSMVSDKKKSKMVRIHKIVAEAFLDNPENKPQINHIDANKFNNNLINLEYCTQLENYEHAVMLGLAKGRIKVIQWKDNFEIIGIWDSLSQASRITGINVGNIHNSLDKFKKDGTTPKKAGGFSWSSVIPEEDFEEDYDKGFV